MVDTKISGLTAGDPALATDQIPVNRGGLDKYITPAGIATYLTNKRVISFAFDGQGSAVTTGVGTPSYVPYAGTIIEAIIMADQSATTTAKIYKTNGAIPNSGNEISATPWLVLNGSFPTYHRITSFSGWTTGVSAQDVFNVDITANSGATKIQVILVIQVS